MAPRPATSVGGILVRAGDRVVADATGVCVIPAHDLEAVHESAVRVRLEAGEPSTPVFGLGAGGPPEV